MKQRSTLLLLVVEVIQGSREAEKNESTCHGASRWLWHEGVRRGLARRDARRRCVAAVRELVLRQRPRCGCWCSTRAGIRLYCHPSSLIHESTIYHYPVSTALRPDFHYLCSPSVVCRTVFRRCISLVLHSWPFAPHSSAIAATFHPTHIQRYKPREWGSERQVSQKSD